MSVYSMLNPKKNGNVKEISQPNGWENFHFFSKIFLFLFFTAGYLWTLSLYMQLAVLRNHLNETHSCVGNECNRWPNPPRVYNYAETARYVMHISEWGSLSTISTHEGIIDYPFVNVFSVSDGPVNNASGIPYFYLTELELSVHDLKKNAKASLTLSENQSDYCFRKNYDAEDPRCAHVIFTGNISKVDVGSKEESFARDSLFSRHPEMPTWPSGHNWFFAKLNIEHIYVLDHFGGATVVKPKDYFGSSPW